jgi:tripartite-type tricarboxylate transporter receptor subunit TctC
MRAQILMLLPVFGLALVSVESSAQLWPAKPLRAVVPIAAGSLTDTVSRVVFEPLSERLGQAIIVNNRPGAGMTLGSGLVARAAPDGYTLLATSSAHTIAPALYPALDYQPVRDFVAVAPLGTSPFVLVVPPGRGLDTARDLVTAAKAKPGAFNFASPGVGTASHLSGERFRLSAGIEAEHVPFKGGAEAMAEVMAGRIDFFFMALGAALPNIRSGKLTALAVNGATRSAVLPDVPTLKEAGIDNADYPTWFGLFLPAGTPSGIVADLHRETMGVLREPKVRDRLTAMGVDALRLSPAEFGAAVEREMAINAALVKAIGLKPQ